MLESFNLNWHMFFIAAMCYNLSLLIFNKFFLSNKLAEIYPQVFSKFGQLIIILFGFIFYFAYTSHKTKELFLLFAIEKILYFLTGIYWMTFSTHRVKFQQYPMEWLFMRTYWIGDLMFGIGFFLFYLI